MAGLQGPSNQNKEQLSKKYWKKYVAASCTITHQRAKHRGVNLLNCHLASTSHHPNETDRLRGFHSSPAPKGASQAYPKSRGKGRMMTINENSCWGYFKHHSSLLYILVQCKQRPLRATTLKVLTHIKSTAAALALPWTALGTSPPATTVNCPAPEGAGRTKGTRCLLGSECSPRQNVTMLRTSHESQR